MDLRRRTVGLPLLNQDQSDDYTEVRIVEQVVVKIGEAKNLPPRNGGSSLRDVYCSINLDREEIFRTTAIEKTLNPFFGEEYRFEIPRQFRSLCFYMRDRSERHGVGGNKDGKVIGKVAVKRDELTKFSGKDHWFQISAVDADSEVEGKIHVEVKMDQWFKPGGTFGQKLSVRIIECSELAIIHGSCDSYVTVTLYQGLTRTETKRTKAKKKTNCPHFDESFHFDIPIRGQNHERNSIRFINGSIAACELRISVMHDASGMFSSIFLGEVRMPLGQLDLLNGHKAWYLLQPRDSTGANLNGLHTTCSKTSPLGSLRLKIQYTSDYVLSSRLYDPLRNQILSSPEIRPITSSAAYILGEIVTNKVDAAQPLVKLFVQSNKITSLIRVLTQWEISNVTDPNTIFRGNTLVSKCMDELMKLVGMRYLHETLRNIINQIITERKPCEIDASRLNNGETVHVNLINLKGYIATAVRCITNSTLMCPQVLCEVLYVLKEVSLQFFPKSREVCYSVLSGFVFLRFFAPALLNPKLFEITDQHIDQQTNRTLTLISKTIQSIGNLVSSKSISNQSVKEDYMTPIYREFLTEHYMEITRVFLELISSSSSVSAHRLNEFPVVLKESFMTKRAQGRKRGRFGYRVPYFNKFKKRYFCLSTQEFHYAKDRNRAPLCRIPTSDILGVEKLAEDTFKMKNMFQIIQRSRVLYIKANNCVEEKEWIDILTKVSQTNKYRLKEYHPAAFISGHWLCCRDTNESAPGCCPVTTCLPPDIGVHIDADREVERIHAILLTKMSTIDSLIEHCQNYQDKSKHYNGFVIEDRSKLWETLKELKKCVNRLDQDHKQYMRRICIRTIYGSAEAPIGDDNYLLMLAKHL